MLPRLLPVVSLCTLLAFAPAHWAQEAAPEVAELGDAKPATVAAERRDLAVTFRGTGRYQADAIAQLKFEPESYGGELVVAEVLAEPGPVSAGQPVLRLEAPELEKQMDRARFALAQAERQVQWARTELEIMQAERELMQERAELARADAEQDWQLWVEVNKADAYRSAALDLERTEARLQDEEEELRQLEELYEGARLASQTQDIVLERARRSLAEMRERVDIARRQNEQTVEVTLPRRERDLQNALGWQRLQQEHAAERMRIKLQQQTASLESAERSFMDSREQMEKLEQDRAALTLVAEEAGVLTGLDANSGDTVQANQTLATLYAPTPNEVTLSIPAADLRLLGVASEVSVRCAAFGELASAGVVESIDWAGQVSGDDARFPAVVRVREMDPRIRPGMAALITAEVVVEDAVVLPRAAVKADDQGSYVTVITDGNAMRREVLLGAGDDQWVQVVHGLEAGEAVLAE